MDNRPLKFRVWDEKYNRWDYPGLMVYAGNIAAQGRIFQQFTGLSDRKGQQIYEGDIVLAKGNGAKYVVKFGEHKSHYSENDDDFEYGFYIERIGRWKGQESIAKAEEWAEVIGNVFENVNLLK